jgi:hypothetical protein
MLSASGAVRCGRGGYIEGIIQLFLVRSVTNRSALADNLRHRRREAVGRDGRLLRGTGKQVLVHALPRSA